jgi:hypothetical protein
LLILQTNEVEKYSSPHQSLWHGTRQGLKYKAIDMKLYLILLSATVLIGCLNPNKKDIDSKAISDSALSRNATGQDTIDVFGIPSNDQFIYYNKQSFDFGNNERSEKYVAESQRHKLVGLVRGQYKEWTDQIYPLTTIPSMYAAFLYSKQICIEKIQPIVLLVEADDYEALQMILLKENGSMSDHLEVAGGIMGDNNWIIWDNYKRCRYLNLSTLQIYENKLRTKDRLASTMTIDSLVFEYKITADGKFQLTKKDSIRIFKHINQSF